MWFPSGSVLRLVVAAGFCAVSLAAGRADAEIIETVGAATRARGYFGARCQGGAAVPEDQCLFYQSKPPFMFPPPGDAPPVGNAGLPVFMNSYVTGPFPATFSAIDSFVPLNQQTSLNFVLQATFDPRFFGFYSTAIRAIPDLRQGPAAGGVAFGQVNFTAHYGVISARPLATTPWGWYALLSCDAASAASYCLFKGEAQFWIARTFSGPAVQHLRTIPFSFQVAPGAPGLLGPVRRSTPPLFIPGYSDNVPWYLRVIGYIRAETDPAHLVVHDAGGTVLGDPFQCYEVRKQAFAGPAVSLTDHFGSANAVPVSVPERLCAPANVDQADPTAPSHLEHLVGHRVRHPFTRVSNQQFVDQFGLVTLDVVRPDRILVPSVKGIGSPPAPVTDFSTDHFQCYVVRRSRGAPRFVPRPGVTVEDQLGSATVVVRQPVRLCAPVDKNGERPGAETNPNHLLCYRTNRVPFPTLAAFVDNQFGARSLEVIHRTELCVPATAMPATTSTTITVTTTTSTTTTTLHPTECCETAQGSPAAALCFDAVIPDAGTKCALLGGTIVPGVCDPTLGTCVAEASPSDWCCECPVPAPPFPHPQLCFNGVLGREDRCAPPCTLVPVVTCGPVTEQCGGSPSGAFVGPEP